MYTCIYKKPHAPTLSTKTICPFTLTISWWINTIINELHMQAPTEYFSGNVKCWFCCLATCCLCMTWTFVFSQCLSCNPDEVSGRSGIFMKHTEGCMELRLLLYNATKLLAILFCNLLHKNLIYWYFFTNSISTRGIQRTLMHVFSVSIKFNHEWCSQLQLEQSMVKAQSSGSLQTFSEIAIKFWATGISLLRDVPHQLANQTSEDVFLCHQDRSYIVFWGLQVWESVENSLVSQLRVFQDDPVQQKYKHTLNIGIPGSPYSLIWRSCHDYRGLLLPVNSRKVHSRLMTHLTLAIRMDSLLKCKIAR